MYLICYSLEFVIIFLHIQNLICFVFVLMLSFAYAGPADLPFFDLLSIFGKLRAGFGAMGLRPGAPVSSCLEVSVFELTNATFPADNFCVVIHSAPYIRIKMKKFGKMFRQNH